MKRFFSSESFTTGLAMFSMFFGAGNVVFPIALGQLMADKTPFAIVGLLITAVGVPFLGLLSMILFNGNYRNFFYRIGKVPGFFVITLIVSLIGPFAAMPRCVTLSHAALRGYMPQVSLASFSVVSAALVFFFSVKKSKLLDVLGYVLSPVLLVSLAVIIIQGLWVSQAAPSNDAQPLGAFLHGIVDGYKTMDLLATFFFSYIVLATLSTTHNVKTKSDYTVLAKVTLKASAIGASLLGLVYVGTAFVASFNSLSLMHVAPDEMLSVVAAIVLGPSLGIIASIAVAAACLTTTITLAAIFADYLRDDLLRGCISYPLSLLVTVGITALFSNLGFSGIMTLLEPMLFVCYPAIIVLSMLNIAYKLFDFQPVRLPVFGTLLFSLYHYLIG